MLETAIRILKDKSNPPKARLDALLYLVEHFEAEHFELLESYLTDPNEHPDVRSAIALSLGKLGHQGEDAASRTDDCVRLLIRHAHDNDVTVRNYSVQALGLLGREEAIPVLLEALHDNNNIIFHSAAEALGQIGKPAVPHLIELLSSENPDDARCIAAWKLGELRYVDAIPKLVKTIQEDSNTELLALSIWALGEIGFGPKEVLDILNWAASHEQTEVNTRASRAIKKIARHCN